MAKKTILITGAHRGIGLEMVRQYAEDGWRVFALSRSPNTPDLSRIAAESSDAVFLYKLDVTDAVQIFTLAKEIKDEPIDILLNNAGTSVPEVQTFGHTNEQEWIEAFKVNTIAPLRMAEAFVEHGARSERKIIATMSSIMASITENDSGDFYAYRSTKAAVNMIVKNLSIDLRGRGITAVALHPGWVRTEMGGPHAPLSPAESVSGLRGVLASLTPEDNGKFYDYQGKELPW